MLKRRNGVNAISPGPIVTPMIGGMVQRGTRRAIKCKPRERCAAAGVDGNPDEIAKAASFFASDDSNLTTGIELFVDGVWRKSEDLGTACISAGLLIILTTGKVTHEPVTWIEGRQRSFQEGLPCPFLQP